MSNYKNLVSACKAMSDENRINIIELLKAEPLCACDIAEVLGLAQSKLSYHMKILCDSGVVDSCSKGKWTYYSVSKSRYDQLIKEIRDFSKNINGITCDMISKGVA